ncbi:MFS transporter [Dactylosporangium sp. CA-233914]|uniref:MFS transporter n=1 Tax=Dactylosporangium sp. CA-233914 TaxID=3239934 RepID=UPI003D936ECD
MTGVDLRAAPPQHASATRRWWMLAIIATAQLMVVLDATIVNIALPSAQAELRFSDGERQWVITAYALAFGSLLLAGGRVADMLGRRLVFLIGLAGFAAASAIGGAATSFELLVTARAAQGVFGALLAPAALALLTTIFAEGTDRTRAFSIFGAVAGSGSAIGLLLGGVLTEYLDWRWTLYVNLGFAAVAIAGGALLLPRTGRDRSIRLDLPGAALSAAGLFAVVFGLTRAQEESWSDVSTWGFLVAGAALLAAFVGRQRRARNPLLPLRVLADRGRAASLLSITIVSAAMFAVFLFLTFYLQQNLHFTPVRTGLAFMPMMVALIVASALSTSVLLPRIGPKVAVSVAMVVAATGMAWFTLLDEDSTYVANVLPALILTGLGIGGVMAPAMSLGTHGVGEHDAGVASATVNTTMQIGGSIGTALLTTLATAAATDYLATHDPSDPLQLGLATLESYRTAFMWSALLFLLGAVLTAVLYRRGALSIDNNAAVHM